MFLLLPRKKIYRVVVWVAELGTMIWCRETMLEFILDSLSRKIEKALESL